MSLGTLKTGLIGSLSATSFDIYTGEKNIISMSDLQALNEQAYLNLSMHATDEQVCLNDRILKVCGRCDLLLVLKTFDIFPVDFIIVEEDIDCKMISTSTLAFIIKKMNK